MSADPGFAEFRPECGRLGIELTEPQYGQLARYATLLREWNSRINLVSRRDTDRILTYHVIDSLAVQLLLPRDARVCDVGTGAGLPGIPLTVVRPDLEMLLVESSQKRGAFLRMVVSELGTERTTVFCERAESLDPLNCDVIVSRLSGPLKDLLKHASKHRKPDGKIVLYKTKESAVDAGTDKILSKHGLRVIETPDVTLPFTDISRRFVVLGS